MIPKVQLDKVEQGYAFGTIDHSIHLCSFVNDEAPRWHGACLGLFDMQQRHFGSGPQWFYAIEDVREPLLFFDGSVRVETTGECNEGFNPKWPRSSAPTWYHYDPTILGFEPQTRSGDQYDVVKGYYRWTRGGLKGIDYGGGEINTGQNP
jgi:hypothetical protein